MNQPQEVTAIQRIQSMLEAKEQFDKIAATLPQDVSPQKFIAVLLANLENKLAEAIVSDRLTQDSFLKAVSLAASDGLLLDGREAVLSPVNKNYGTYDNADWHVNVGYMAMAYGMTQLLFRAGISIRANVVYEKDKFSYTLGDEEKIVHEPSDGDRGRLTKAYAIARVNGYPEPFREVMGVTDINAIKRASKAAKKGSDKKTILTHEDGSPQMSGPWATFEGEMWRKSVIRRIQKRLPRMAQDALKNAIEADNEFYELPTPKAQPTAETQAASQPVAVAGTDGRPAGLAKVAAAATQPVAEEAPRPQQVAPQPAPQAPVQNNMEDPFSDIHG
jgi:recombination protein RecT